VILGIVTTDLAGVVAGLGRRRIIVQADAMPEHGSASPSCHTRAISSKSWNCCGLMRARDEAAELPEGLAGRAQIGSRGPDVLEGKVVISTVTDASFTPGAQTDGIP